MIPRINILILLILTVTACSTKPIPPPESVTNAFQLATEGKFNEAVSVLTMEEKKHPKDAVYPFYLGRLSAQYFNDINRGNVRFLELKKLPHLPFGQYLQMKNPDGSIAGYQYKDMSSVLDHYLRAIRKDASFADAYIEASMLYASMFQISKAIQLLNTAAQKMPGNHRFPFLLAYINRQLGDNDKALDMYHKAAQCSPDSSEVHLYMGTLLLKMDRIKDAAAALSRVIDLNNNPKDVTSALSAFFLHFYLKGIKHDKQSLRQAIAWGERFINEFKKQPRMLIRLGKACYLSGAKGKALTYLKEGLDEIPTDPQALTFLAELQAEKNNTAAAIQTYNRSLTLQDRYLTRYLLGTLLLKDGKPGEAVVHLERAAVLRKGDPEILHSLATALDAAAAAPDVRRKGWLDYIRAAANLRGNAEKIAAARKILQKLPQ